MDEGEGELREQLARGRMTVIVGAGVSIEASGGAPCASWRGLLAHGAREAAADPDFRSRLKIVEEEIASDHMDDLLSAAEKISRVLGAPDGGSFGLWLRQSVGSLPLVNRGVLEALRDLSPAIATTNYDGLLESVMTERRAVSWKQRPLVERVLQGDDPGILHLHGYWEDPHSIILGRASYEQMVGDEHAQCVLRALRLRSTLMFVGCGSGLEDPNFEKFRAWLARVMRGSEYRSYRLALAADVDRLQKLHREEGIRVVPFGERLDELAPFLRSLVAPQSSSPRWPRETDQRDAYLSWLTRIHELLDLRGLRGTKQAPQVPLERVYVALRGDRTTSFERMQARELLDAEVRELIARLDGQLGEVELREQAEVFRRRFLRDHPVMPSLVQRDRPLQPQMPVEIISLAEAFRTERWLVILGDPGSGKTTLARWLTLKLAQAHLAGHERLLVPARQVDVEAADPDAMVDLGPVRLPVLLRVADFAEHYQRSPGLLIDYLGHHPWLGQLPTYHGERLSGKQLNALIRRRLSRGEVVLILDGMDEIANTSNRESVTRAFEEFIQDWLPMPGAFGARGQGDPSAPVTAAPPFVVGGNQIVVTSRIAGYHAAPIRGNLTHVTIEPMSQPAVDQFCDAWMGATLKLLNPGADARVIEEQARNQAGKLKSAIFDPEHPRIRELATNPLLVTILAMVHHSRGSLPQRRAELYQLAMEILIEDWRKTSLTIDEIVFVLSPLAAHVHENYATGLIEESELQEIVCARLAELRGLDALDPPVGFRRDVAAFMRIVREDVGLLVARGEAIYGFVHLTFQEYLAALDLVQSRKYAAENVVRRLGDPRWKEPIVLALGHVASTWGPRERERLVGALLDAHNPRDLFPTIPFLLVSALEEMPGISVEQARRIVRHLLVAGASIAGTERSERLRARIERALERLWAVMPRALEAELCDTLRAPPDEAPGARFMAAALIDAQVWFTPSIVAALIEAQRYDSQVWGFPIHRAVRSLLTARLFIPTNAKPQMDETMLRELKSADPRQYNSLQRCFQIAQAAWRVRQSRRDRLVEVREIDLPASALPMRQALCDDESLVSWLLEQPAWLRVVTTLYGGYPDYRSAETRREYRKLARFLQQPDGAREKQIQGDEEFFFGGPWGGDVTDVVYAIAVYLDQGMAGKLKVAEQAPAFDPKAVDRDCALTNLLLGALRRRESSDRLSQLLWFAWKQGENEAIGIDAFVALVALGEDLRSELGSVSPEGARRIQDRLALVMDGLRDPATRTLAATEGLAQPVDHPLAIGSKKKLGSRSSWGRVLDQLQTVVPSRTWNELFRAFAQISMDVSGEPINEPFLFAQPVPLLKAEMVASYLAGTAIDDFVYYAALALDDLRRQSPELFMASLHAVPDAASIRSSLARIRWGAGQVLPRLRDIKEVPLEVIEMADVFRLEALSPSLTNGLLEVLLDQAVKLPSCSPATAPELLVVNLQNATNAAAIRAKLGFTEWSPQSMVAEILRLARAVGDPQGRSRALLRLARQSPDLRLELREEALAAAMAISNSLNRCRVLERLAPFFESAKRDEIVAAALHCALQIADVDDQARMFARFARFRQGRELAEVLEAAVVAAGKIEGEWERAETLRAIRDVVCEEQRAAAAFHSEVERLSAAQARWLATGRVGMVLLASEADLHARSEDRGHSFWTPVILAGLVGDQLDPSQKSGEVGRLWSALAADASEEAIVELCEHGMVDGLQITTAAMDAIEALLSTGKEALVMRLLPLLQEPVGEIRWMLARWLQHSHPLVRSYSALYLSEDDARPTAGNIHGLLSLLVSKSERARARVAQVLWAGDSLIKREARRFRTSTLDSDVLNAVYCHISKMRSPETRTPSPPLASFSLDLVHDDPGKIDAAVADAMTDSQTAPASLVMLEEIFEATAQVWERLKAAYVSGSPQLRRALAQSFVAMWVKCWFVFTALQIYADRWPAAFANLAAEHGFEECLAEVVATGGLSAREAMLTLGLLNGVSPKTIDALQAPLVTGSWAEEYALLTFERLRRVGPSVIDVLSSRLLDESALVAATSAKVLSLLGRGDRLDPARRRHIIDALTAAVRDPRSVRGIYAPLPRAGLRDLFVARLDERFLDALDSIIGIMDI